MMKGIITKKIYDKDGFPTGEEKAQNVKPEWDGMGYLIFGLIMLMVIIDQVFW